tara:strand:- start:1477 stop:1719 length:243 start_codon:yes stop_codon:yes gene_type:complete
MYFIITAMLFFGGNNEVIYTQYDKATFDSNVTCQEFLFQNKVMLTIELLQLHNKDGSMKGFEYFCESRYPTEPKEPGLDT